MSRPTPGTFCWHELATPDAARSRDFYASLFGWTAEEQPMAGDVGGTYTMLRLDGRDVAGLYETTGHMAQVPPHWAAYVACDDVDATAAAAREGGATLLFEPMDVPDVGRLAAFRAPGGEVLSLFGDGERNGSDSPEPAPGAFCWDELLTRDVDGSGSFYTGVFPWSARVEEMTTGPYTVFHAGERMVAGMLPMPPGVPAQVPAQWMPYVRVTDCEATTEKARGLGAAFLVENLEVPTVGTLSMVTDPGGATLAFVRFSA